MIPPTTASIDWRHAAEEKSAWPRWKRVKVSDFAHQPFPEIGKRPALRLAEAHDVTELADRRETAVEDAGAGRIHHLVDALAAGEARITTSTKSSSSRLTTLAAPKSSARSSLPFVPTVPMTVAPARTASCVANRPTPPPMAWIRMTSPGLVTLTLCSRCHAVSAWIGKAAAMSRPMPAGIGIKRFDPGHALIGEAARFLQESRDAVADLHARYARSERSDPAGDLEPADDRIALRMRIGSADDHRVGEIAAAIGDVDQRFAGTGYRLRRVAHPQIVFDAGSVDDDRAQGCRPVAISSRAALARSASVAAASSALPRITTP